MLRETERAQVGGGAERERNPSRLRSASTEPEMGLKLMNRGEHNLSRNQESEAQLTEQPRYPENGLSINGPGSLGYGY